MKFDSLPQPVRLAVEAAQNKKAAGITVLDLSGIGAFTEHFVVCTGFSRPQVQAISDEVESLLAQIGLSSKHREGYTNAEWALLDFGALVVHVFGEQARRYYDLERLWRSAKKLEISDEPAHASANVFPDVSAGGAHGR